MASPVIEAYGNINIALDVKRFCQTLREDIHNVVVAIGSIVELNTKCALPLLCLQDVLGVWGMEEKGLKLDFTHTRKLRPRLNRGINVVAKAVVAFEKPDFWIEVWSHRPMLRE